MLVALSTLESNKYDKVLNWKCRTDFTLENEHNNEAEPIVLSEFGDLKVTRIRQPQKRLSEAEIAQAATEYQNGMTTYQLAEKYGCTRQTISNALKQYGVQVTKCKASKKIDADEVITMYADMLNSEQIAKKFGVSPQVITKCLRDNSIKIRTRWDY